MSDYIGIIYIGGGSSWGRSPDKEKAITNAINSLRDWMSLYEVGGVEVTINVVDVDGYSTVSWGHGGLIGTSEKTGEDEKIASPVEIVKRTTPKWRRRK